MNQEQIDAYIEHIQNIDLDKLESFSLRSLREITLHNLGLKVISNTDYEFATTKLKLIDDELVRRRPIDDLITDPSVEPEPPLPPPLPRASNEPING